MDAGWVDAGWVDAGARPSHPTRTTGAGPPDRVAGDGTDAGWERAGTHATLGASFVGPRTEREMPRTAARRALLTTALVLGLSAVAVPAHASGDLTLTDAEDRVLALINRDRAAAGLVAVRADSRLREIARARSNDMVARSYFAHEQPDGRNVFDLIEANGIRWYAAGEIIAWNTWPTLADSAAAADTGWLESPGHRAVVLSRDYNYAGFGLAVAPDGRKLWTGVFLKGPDRTRPTARTTSFSRPSATAVRLVWRGGDVRLQTLTAGLRDFQVQRRLPGGTWSWVTRSTTATTRTVSVSRGRTYEFRVRSRDRAGNVSRWSDWLSVAT